MFVNEVIGRNFGVYAAAIRVVLDTFSVPSQTVICADSRQGAIAMLARIYGARNVIWVREVVNEARLSAQIQLGRLTDIGCVSEVRQPRKSACVQVSSVSETETQTRVLSSAELQVKSMADKAQQYKEQAKALKARQQLAKAQAKLLAVQRNAGT